MISIACAFQPSIMTQGNAGHKLSVKLQYIQNHFVTQLSVCLVITTERTAFHERTSQNVR